MYDLGQHFKIDYSKCLGNENSIIKGEKYRITVLSDSLIRLEYNEEGKFNDKLTQLALNRNFPAFEFEKKEDKKYLEIVTKNFRLSYVKEKPFKGSLINKFCNLKVESIDGEKSWYFGKPDIRNLSAPKGLSDKKSKFENVKGLYTDNGMVCLDDSTSLQLQENGEYVKIDKTIDLYLFVYNDNFLNCLKDYYTLSGYPPLMPRYAFGNWWSRNITYDDELLKKAIDDFQYNEIPISVLLLNNWSKSDKDKKINSSFSFNEKFVNPTRLIEYVNNIGIRVGLNINPSLGIQSIENYYEKVKEYITPDEKGLIPFNMFDSKYVDIYLKMMIHPLDNMGVDFYWIDAKMDEKDLFLLNHYHYYDTVRDFKKRPMLLTGHTGISNHRVPAIYAGKSIVNWKSLKLSAYQIVSSTNMGNNFISHDIGGYYKGTEDNELYIRFVQLGTFSPILKFGSDNGKYYKREPWRWSVKTYTIAKQYLQLRHKLIPYLYNESYIYHKEGISLIKPLYYSKKEMYDDELFRNEYYFGSQMFVAPIVNKKDYVMNRVIHKFYLPEGVWFDFTTGKKFIGNKQYVSFYKDQDYPVFAKAGAIILMGHNDNLCNTNPPKNMEIHLFPGVSNKYDYYEDDGISTLYKKDFFLKSSIEYNYLPNNYAIIIRAVTGKSAIVPEYRNYKIVLRNTKEARDLTVYFNNEPIQFTKYVDGPNFIIEVTDVKTIGQLTINCRGKDIEIEASRIINEDIESIISDLELETTQKEKIDSVIFSELSIQKKRIAIRKLSRIGLERKFIKLFLKLLEYIEQV